MQADLDNITSKLPPWDLQVIIHGITYAIRQPTIEEDLKFEGFAKETKSAEVVVFFWALFDGPQPAKSAMNRDTLMMLYTQLLLYRRARNKLYTNTITASAKLLDAAMAAALPMVKSTIQMQSPKPN